MRRFTTKIKITRIRHFLPAPPDHQIDLPLPDDSDDELPPPAKMPRYDSPTPPQVQEIPAENEAPADDIFEVPFNAIKCCLKCKDGSDKSSSVACGICFFKFLSEEKGRGKLYVCVTRMQLAIMSTHHILSF